MKFGLDKVIFINLLFRIFLLIYLLKEDGSERSPRGRTLNQWLKPVSKRVVLIFLNGLDKNFLNQNSTPFLSEALRTRGVFGVVPTSYVQTNSQGMQAVLRGRYSPWFPLSWTEGNCVDSILDYIYFSCAMGSFPPELSWRCHVPSKNPLKSYQELPGLFERKRCRNSLYILSHDLDPVLVGDYQSRLREIDEDIRGLENLVERFYADNKTTYIVTSARGSPLGKVLSTDAPVLTWGNAISFSRNRKSLRMRQTDLAAMLCTLLGTNFPSGLFGVIPVSMMNLSDDHKYEMTLYTVRHFEKVLELVDPSDLMTDSSKLTLPQLTRLVEVLVEDIETAKAQKLILNCIVLVLLLVVSGVNLISSAVCGLASFFCHFKSLFVLFLCVGTTLYYWPPSLELLIPLELLMFCTWQNNKHILQAFANNALLITKGFSATLAATIAVALVGNRLAVPLMLGPVILWPFLDGSYHNLTRFVLITRLLSGVVLGALPMSRTFGEMPDSLITASVSFVFLVSFYLLLFVVFKREFDMYMKINFIVILATTIHVCFIQLYKFSLLRDTLSCLFLAFSLLSAYVTSGTLLEKFSKILLSLFVPVLMLTVWLESIFYLSVVFHLFTWIIMGYHSANTVHYQLGLPIFSIEAKKPLNTGRISREDVLYVVFFLVYTHVSYLAIGHFPGLHSYDLYVVPTFIFPYPHVVSYFLAGLKFFLPFFVVTTSFLTLCLVREKNYKAMVAACVSASDLIGCFLTLYFQIENFSIKRALFSARFTYFIIQQFAIVSVILSYFIGKHLLLDSHQSRQRISPKRDVEQ